MADSVSTGRSPKPHGLDWRPVLDSYRTQTEGLREPEEADQAATERIEGDHATMSADAAPVETDRAQTESGSEMAAPVNLRKLQEQLDRSRLDEIAALVLSLTYGEMIELANAIWKSQPDGPALTQETLPALLYRWSKAQSGPARRDDRPF